MIKRRHVFHVAGYDPISPESQIERFRRSMSISAPHWNSTATVSELHKSADGASAYWTCEARGPDWQTETTYEVLGWDDLIRKDFSRGTLSRLIHSLITFFDWLITGTLFRYLKSSWRYTGFFMFPYVYLAGFAFFAFIIGKAVWTLCGLLSVPSVVGLVVSFTAAFAVLLAVLRFLGDRWLVNHVLDDWIFAREFVYGRRPDMEARLDLFADKLVACAKAAAADEIIVLGHCLGCALVMDVVARALARDPDLARHGATLCVLTVGATIPKFSLHPAGERFHQAALRVAKEPAIRWGEYHARDDMVSFYMFDPVSMAPIQRGDTHGAYGKPCIRRVQFKDMLQKDTYERNRFNFMRLHYQFVMANDRRSAYDYFIFVCGPLELEKIISVLEGPVALFGPDGEVLKTAAKTPAPEPTLA